MSSKTRIKKHVTVINVISSGTQVLLTGIIYFFLYRFLLKTLGVELLGVWSVVLSTSSLAILANFGVSDSVVRFVALYSKKGDEENLHDLIFTSSLFLLGLSILMVIVIYPCADFILKLVIPIKYLKNAIQILPYSVSCLVINAVNGVYSSALDGLQKYYVRNLIFAASSILLLAGALFFVPKFGLEGVAIAQIIQSISALLACSAAVIYKLKFNPLKWRWNGVIFRQIFSYGTKFQFISLAAMLNEPVTKILLSRFGGLAFAGYYEMANRLLMQARGVIVNGTQSLVPVMVNLDKGEIFDFYKKTFSNILFFSITSVCLIISLSHFVSLFWIGRFQPIFYYTLILLSVNVIFNLLATPSYFFYMAKAKLNVLISSHLLSSFTSVAFSFILGYFFGGYGVTVGWILAIVIGSVYLINFFYRDNNISHKAIPKMNDIYFCCLIIFVTLINVFQVIKINFIAIDFISATLIIIISGLYFMKYKLKEIFNK